MSADIEKWKFRDPAEVAERLEAQSCHGCKFGKYIDLTRMDSAAQEITYYCDQGRRYGNKCKQYQERGK